MRNKTETLQCRSILRDNPYQCIPRTSLGPGANVQQVNTSIDRADEVGKAPPTEDLDANLSDLKYESIVAQASASPVSNW